MSPQVSLLIPCYGRPVDLKQALSRALEQDYDNLEIIVVDDCTPDDSVRAVVAQFEPIRYERPSQNLGLIGARNFGASLCSGEYIINLDDDSWFIEPDGISRAVDIMEKSPSIGVLALNIGVKDSGYQWKVADKPAAVPYYTGCGNVYRKSILEVVGPYMAEFWRQGEELERCLRIMDAGYSITSAPSIRVFHDQSIVNRDNKKHVALTAVNNLRRELLRAPVHALPYGLGRAALFAMTRWNRLNWELFWREVSHKRWPLGAFFTSMRKPVKASTYWRWWGLVGQARGQMG